MDDPTRPGGTLASAPPPGDGGKSKVILIAAAVLVAVGVVVAVVLMSRGGGTTPAAAPAPTPAPPAAPKSAYAKPGKLLEKADLTIPSADLLAKFQADKDAADAEHNGKVIDVTGEVFRTQQDLTRGWFVALSGGSERFAGVRCYFPPENQPQLDGLENGTPVTIRGRYDGADANVLLKDCAILEPAK